VLEREKEREKQTDRHRGMIKSVWEIEPLISVFESE